MSDFLVFGLAVMGVLLLELIKDIVVWGWGRLQ